MDEPTKPCSTCNEEKPFSAYRKQAGKPFGLRYQCRECQDRLSAERYQKKREQIIVQVKTRKRQNQPPVPDEEDDFLK